MVKDTLLVLLALAAIAATPPVRTLYNDAMAKEQAVRKAMAEPAATDAMLKAVHEAIATYEAVVRRYPASSYSDNALWQAGRLALDAYAKFNQAADKDAAERFFKRLAASYPSSTLAKQVPDVLAKLDAPAAAAPLVDVPIKSAVVVVPPPPAARSAAASASPPRPAPTGSIATIKSIRRSVLPDAVRVVIELDAEVPFRQDRIPDPSRVFVDLPGTRAAASLIDQTMRFELDADVVRQVRIGRHPNNTTRVVLDASGVSSYSVYPLYNPYRLVIDCVRATPGGALITASTTTSNPSSTISNAVSATSNWTPSTMAANTAPMTVSTPAPPKLPFVPVRREPVLLLARPAGSALLRRAPSSRPRHGVLLAEAREPEPAPVARASVPPRLPPAPLSSPLTGPFLKPVDPPTPTPAPVAASAAVTTPRHNPGGLSIARQLGLTVSRIVIDPGHGGHDSGAKGKGVVEAELVLDVALRVEKLLQKVPGVEVILTRRTDDFIELSDRTAMANRDGADLFLSIHANASTSTLAHGIETYFLNFATNLSAAATAARENANSTQAMGALPDLVRSIALNNKVDESHDLASHVQNAMVERLRPANKALKDLGVKQAPFVVLIGAVMPSVLAEISFVTNPQEARLLKANAYRQRIAEALFEGIRKYQTSLRATTTLATQR